MPPFVAPDVLVLAGGGVLGEAWMTGVLGGIEDASGLDLRRIEALVGTSAGAIVAARLAAGEPPRRPTGDVGTGEPGPAAPDRRRPLRAVARRAAGLAWAASAPITGLAVGLGAPGGALVRSAVLARAPDAGRRLDRLHAELRRLGARFDGRLRVCCVDKDSGRRVVFGAPGAPPAEVADAVVASCAIPWVFAPVWIAGHEYVDGGVWSVTNLDAAPAGRQTEVLCLDPVAGLDLARSRMALIRQGFRISAALEIQLLRRRGARVHHVAPDPRATEAMGPNLMDPRRAQDVLVAGYGQGRALAAGDGARA
jgi:NTE family protein